MNLVKNDLVEPVQVKSEGMNMTEGSNSIQVKNEPTVPEDSVQVKGELVDQNQPTQSVEQPNQPTQSVEQPTQSVEQPTQSVEQPNQPTQPNEQPTQPVEPNEPNEQPTQSIADQEIQEVASQQDQTSLLPVPSFFFIFINRSIQ